jgi:hypothetical protein
MEEVATYMYLVLDGSETWNMNKGDENFAHVLK